MIILNSDFWENNKNRIYSSGFLGITLATGIFQATGKCDNLQCQTAIKTPDQPVEVVPYQNNLNSRNLENITVSGSGHFLYNNFNV